MKSYTFEMPAMVTVSADTEEEARMDIIRTCQEVDEDIYYEEIAVYLPSYEDLKLVDVYDQD